MIKLKSGELSFFEAFISFEGRIGRKVFSGLFLFLIISYFNIYLILNLINISVPTVVSFIFFYMFISIYIKRFHDFNRSGWWILLVLIPFFGLLYINFLAFIKRGKDMNKYGLRYDQSKMEYFKNPNVGDRNSSKLIVNDVTAMNPVIVKDLLVPGSIEDIISFMKERDDSISIGGGRFSMGGHTASPNSVHIDMRPLNKILNYSLEDKTIKVQAGARWCDIQKFVSQFGLAVKIMQTYANFTVGGSLSVNVHGRYIGLGAVVMSVKNITIVSS